MPAGPKTSRCLHEFHSCTQTWFTEAFDEPTLAQQQAWPAITSAESTLLLAPTGSGKTLAAFLASLDRLMFAGAPAAHAAGSSRAVTAGVRTLYISPLKALGVDIDRNLRAPIAGIRAVAGRTGTAFHEPTVAIRSGDTTQRERQQIARHPPDILITTPESLYLMLTSKAEAILASVETVIIDEIHVMVPTKRGVHLFLSLERLEHLRRRAARDASGDTTGEAAGSTPRPLQRIGLSATQRPLQEVARLLGGAEATANADDPVRPRPVKIIDATTPKQLELTVEVPVEDMARLGDRPILPEAAHDASAHSDVAHGAFSAPSPPSIWPSIQPRLLALIRAHRSTMVFVNSRRLAERLAAAINELASEDDPQAGEIVLAHHGSVAKEKRAAIEDRLKRGTLPAIVATSSLELGIDMGAVDLVIQIEAPPTIASGMQRIGRAGHSVGEISRGVIFPKFRGDLLACSAATGRMLAGEVEETFYPRNPLDLLAQQLVAIVSREPVEVDSLYALVRGAAPYADLPRASFEGVLDMLAGRYPSEEFAELRPRVNWDRLTDVVSPRRGTQRLAILNGGTIPDRGLYGVFLAGDGADVETTDGRTGGSRVGELDEEMVFETQPGDVFLLGASSWRVLEITRDRVIVAPAPGQPGRMPFWRGDAPGRPLEFGRAIGQLARELSASDAPQAISRLENQHALNPQAATNLLRYLSDQQAATTQTPSDRAIIVESFLDEIGDWRVCLLSPFGARVHAPWAIAIAARLREEGAGEVDSSWSDDGLMFRLPESDAPPALECFLPKADEVEQLVTQQLGSTALFAAKFRENAARALLLPKRRPQGRTPLWMQRRRSADLLQVASRYPSFPLLLETYRECLRDVFDLPGLELLLRDIEQRRVSVAPVQTHAPSPFAASLLFNYTANFLYEGDAPLAERRAAALALDHAQLQELLGSTDFRELLDAESIDEIALQLAQLDRPAIRDADDLHDLLMSLGTLTREEIEARRDRERVDPPTIEQWTRELLKSKRIIAVRIAGEDRLAAAGDAARLRDALGVNPAAGLPAAFLEQVDDPLGDLVARYARTHGPFTAGEVAARLGLGEAPVRTTLERLAELGRVVEGAFLPRRQNRQWCAAGVLRQIKRRSLAKLRRQVEAAPAESLARLLPAWQGVTAPRRGLDALLDIIEQLQGTPLVASELETEILPSRVIDYQPADLDELFLAGEVAWRGIDSLGVADGRIALYMADQQRLLAPALQPAELADEPDPAVEQICELLGQRGAVRFDELSSATQLFQQDLVDALWRLVWRGVVTNDTLAPLRSMVRGSGQRSRSQRQGGSRGTRRGSRRPRFRSRRALRLPGAEGRWSLLPSLDHSTPTEHLAATAAQLLQRYGVFTRSMAARELTPGGFASLYPVLKAMEESGKARRGYFVQGLGGAQFATAGADDLLRARSNGDEPPQVLTLAATDPANAYGAALPWPTLPVGENQTTDTARPRRVAGAVVVLADGNLLAYLSKNGGKLTTFLANDDPERTQQIHLVAQALASRARNRAPVLLQQIDGARPAASPLAEALATVGFAAISQGFVHRGE